MKKKNGQARVDCAEVGAGRTEGGRAEWSDPHADPATLVALRNDPVEGDPRLHTLHPNSEKHKRGKIQARQSFSPKNGHEKRPRT